MADSEKPKRPPIASLVDLFSDEFGEIADQIIPEIRANLDLGMNPRTAVNVALAKFHVDQKITDSILDKLVKAAAIGFGVEPTAVVNPVGIRDTFLNNHWRGDSLTLSQRIARADYKQIIIDTMDAQMRRSASWTQTAQALSDKKVIAGNLPGYIKRLDAAARKNFVDQPELKAEFLSALKEAKRKVARLSQNGAPNQTVKTIYGDIIRAAETLDDKALDKALHQAVKDKARYNAERIARTEMARAYGAGVDLNQLQDTDVVAERSMLSTRHPKPDICNFFAEANLFGMGPGVYPKTHKPPYPYHAHCMCLKVDVFEGEVEFKSEFHSKLAQEYLESLPVGKQQDLLGVAGQEAFAKNPKSWQKHLKNWEGVQPVKAVEGLKPEMFAPQKPVSPIAPPAQSLEVSLAATEARIRTQRFESAAAFDAAGNRLFFKDGGEFEVEFTAREKDLMRGNILTHNHPRGWGHPEDDPRHGGNSFSIADVHLAANTQLQEIRAVSPGYDFSIKPGEKGWNPQYFDSTIYPAFKKADKELYSSTLREIEGGRLSVEHAEAEHYHNVWERVSKELGLQYSRKRISK